MEKDPLHPKISAPQTSPEVSDAVENEEHAQALLAILRKVAGDLPIEMSKEVKSLCQSIFELDQNDKIRPEEKRHHERYRRAYSSMILGEYWKPKTPPDRWYLYRCQEGKSAGGFLGWGEVLETVIAEDAVRLRDLGQNHNMLGLKLKELLDGQNSDKYEVKSQAWLGYQECPFKGCEYEHKMCPHSSADYTIINRGTGEKIRLPGLVWHLIAQHQFFEGKGSPYRVDPDQLVKVLFE